MPTPTPTPHAHAHEDQEQGGESPHYASDHSEHAFPHERLDAWHIARSRALIENLPRAYGNDAKQIRASAGAVPRLIAEGADRWSARDKRHKFEMANGEVGETVSSLRDLVDDGVLDLVDVEPVIRIWARVGHMLVGLIRHHQR